MSDPRVSVLIPVYNAAPYLQEAVESILSQTYRDFEVIIVNDGSTDRSGKLLRKMASRDSRILLIDQPNRGIVAALNNGLQRCRGELIARMDADDVSMPERFDRQVAYLDACPECVGVGSRVLQISPYGDILSSSGQHPDHEWIEAELLKGNGAALIHPTAMFRKQAGEAVGGYQAQFQWVEDLDLFLRLAEIGRLANLPDVLLHYRQHPDSVSRKHGHEQHVAVTAVVKEAHSRRGMRGDEVWRTGRRLAALPGVTIAEWTTLERSLEQNAYGDRQSSLLKRDGDGALVFTPQTPQDHVATPFVLLDGAAASRAIQVVATVNSTADAPCFACLQDQGLNILAPLRLDGAGERRTVVVVSPQVTHVRVMFRSPDREPQQLPTRICIIDHKG